VPVRPTRYVIMMDHHMDSGSDWPVVFIRDRPEELRSLPEYSKVWRWLPRNSYSARSTREAVFLLHTPSGERHAGKIYSLRYEGGAP